MKRSGLTRLYYLIEDFDKRNIEADHAKDIWDIKMQLQITDGFRLVGAATLQDVVYQYRLLTSALRIYIRYVLL